jgi:hypothetical protein
MNRFYRVAACPQGLDESTPCALGFSELASFCLEVVNEAKNEPKKICAEIPSPRAF